MKEYFFSKDNLAEVNINTAQSCLIKAVTSIKEEEKIKALILASKLLDVTLNSYGVNIRDIKIKKEKNNKNKFN